MSLIFGQNEIIGMLIEPIQHEQRAMAVIDEQYEVIYANAAFNTHFGLIPDATKRVFISDVLPINVRYAYQDFMQNSHLFSTRVVSDLFSGGFTKKQIGTLLFSKINVENRVLSLLILHHDNHESSPTSLVS